MIDNIEPQIGPETGGKLVAHHMNHAGRASRLHHDASTWRGATKMLGKALLWAVTFWLIVAAVVYWFWDGAL